MNAKLVKANKEIVGLLYRELKKIYRDGKELTNVRIKTVSNCQRPILLWSLEKAGFAIGFHRGLMVDSIFVFSCSNPHLTIFQTDVLRIDSGVVGRRDEISDSLSIKINIDTSGSKMKKLIKRIGDELAILCRKNKVPVQDIFNPGGKVVSMNLHPNGTAFPKKIKEMSVVF